MKTVNGVYLDINESDYIYELDGVAYYFSSEFNLNRFKDKVIDYVNNETMKLKNKYRVNCNFDLFFQIAFYKKIEKRGYKVVELSDNRVITKETTILNTIV